MKNIIKKKTMSTTNSPKRQQRILQQFNIKDNQIEKRPYMKGKSIIYQQHNYSRHVHPPRELLNRFNPNLIDSMSRTELQATVNKLAS